MAIHFGKLSLFLLLVLPTTFMVAGPDGKSSVLVSAGEAEDDLVEDVLEDEEEADVTIDDGDEPVDGPSAAMENMEEEEEEEEEKPLKPSPDADTYILFTRPHVGTDFPTGEMVKFLVGFHNKGEQDFLVESMDAAFRYSQDYSFYIQNFTAVKFDRLVEPEREATFEYSFLPSESFSSRPFGLTINLNYKDTEGIFYQDAVFNETINVVEPDEGLDGETFFLYIFLAALVVLAMLGAQQLFTLYGKKHLPKSSRSKPVVEMGTQNKSDIDYDWIPKSALNDMNKSPKRSPNTKTSPRPRRAKRNAGSDKD